VRGVKRQGGSPQREHRVSYQGHGIKSREGHKQASPSGQCIIISRSTTEKGGKGGRGVGICLTGPESVSESVI